MRPPITIAIDGPAASGKSAVGSALSAELGYRFFDTGAMYRAMTWLALHRNVDVHDPDALAMLAASVRVDVQKARTADGGTIVKLDSEDATPHLRDATVEANVSVVSRVPAVRASLVRIQRMLAEGGGVVMAGRDIGSVVLPRADVKVYLDASREVRAQRRAAQMRRDGQDPNMDALVADLTRRDGMDSTRDTSPLTAAPGAVIINTDDISIEEVVQRIVALAHA